MKVRFMPSMEQIRQAHPRQWLAVEVTEEDPETHQAKTGEVVATARTRDDIWEKTRDYKGDDLYILFTGPALPEGYIAGFLYDLEV